MSTTLISTFREIHQHLVLQSSKNLKKTKHTKIFNSNFLKFKTTDKDENGMVELALKAESNKPLF